VNRKGTGSLKWEAMYQQNPGVDPAVIPLSVADMELLNPPEIIGGLKEHLDTAVLGYTEPTPQYNQAVLDWMKRRHNWDIKEEWIIQSPGVVPALFAAVRAFTEPGDGVIIMTPVYYPFFKAIGMNGRVPVHNPLIRDDGALTYGIDYDDLEAKARNPQNKLLILCSPHNPVGRVWKKEELRRVSEICLRNNVLVISDEIHFDIVLPGTPGTPKIEHTVYAILSNEAEQNCVVCTAPSKTFNLAGMAVSNNIVPNKDLRDRLQNEFRKSCINMIGGLGLKACELAYSKCEPWLDGFLQLLEGNYRFVKDYFAKYIPEVKVYTLEGTYLLWLDFRAFGLAPEALERFMTHEAQWFTDEGGLFGDEGRGFERINLACPLSVLQEALERLKKVLEQRRLASS
jgi:putative C-S lyase